MAKKKRFLLRVDPSIYNALERWAADEYRSVNAHIEYILRSELRKAGRLPVGAKHPQTKQVDKDPDTLENDPPIPRGSK